MRETPAVSVCPTVSDSMLKPRRRKSDEIRFRTPGLLSTYTAKVCMISIRGGFRNGRGTPNHFVQVGAGRNHRIDGVFLLDPEVDERAAFTARFGNHRGEIGPPGDRCRPDAEGLAQLLEVGRRN